MTYTAVHHLISAWIHFNSVQSIGVVYLCLVAGCTYCTCHRDIRIVVGLRGIISVDLPFYVDIEVSITACWRLRKENCLVGNKYGQTSMEKQQDIVSNVFPHFEMPERKVREWSKNAYLSSDVPRYLVPAVRLSSFSLRWTMIPPGYYSWVLLPSSAAPRSALPGNLHSLRGTGR